MKTFCNVVQVVLTPSAHVKFKFHCTRHPSCLFSSPHRKRVTFASDVLSGVESLLRNPEHSADLSHRADVFLTRLAAVTALEQGGCHTGDKAIIPTLQECCEF